MPIKKEMPLLKKLGLWFLGVVVVFSLLVWIVTPSHAAMATDPRIAEVERIWEKFDPNLILFEDGFTLVGYEIFFPGRDAVEGLVAWRKLSPFERLSFLEKEGVSLPRGIWASRRNDELVRDVRRNNPDISDAGVSELLGTLGIETVRACVASQSMHPDLCIFFLGRIANRAEILAAQRQVGWYLWRTANQRELDAVRRSSALPLNR